MDIKTIASGAVAQSVAQKTGDAVGVTVARKALDIQETQAAQLIDSAKKSAPKSSEPHLGNHINVHA